MTDISIKSEWILWYHSISDSNWEKESYSKLCNIKNLYDYKVIEETFKQNHYQNGMFFLMKKEIFPNWEDPNNRLGGCLSFKVPSTNIIDEWSLLLLKCIKGIILNKSNDNINGISISPKKEFNIIKIWFREEPLNIESILIKIGDSINIDNSIYKKHSIKLVFGAKHNLIVPKEATVYLMING